MQKIRITDTTLRKADETAEVAYSFREKIEIVKTLDRIGVDVIELPLFRATRADVLLLHTVLPIVKNATISLTLAELTEEAVRAAAEALGGAKNARIHIALPVSTVQMEYHLHKKPDAALALIRTLVSLACSLVDEVEFSALDATRAEADFLTEALSAAATAGAGILTVCDSEGSMLPDEFVSFLSTLRAEVPALAGKELSVESSDAMHMGCALAVAAIGVGATVVKTAVGASGATPLPAFAAVLKMRGDSLGITSSLNAASLGKTAEKIYAMGGGKTEKGTAPEEESAGDICLRNTDDEATVAAAVATLGYELSEEDMARVYESFRHLSAKKDINARELDVIVASVALQVAPTYILRNYVITSSNVIAAAAQIELEKDGEILRGVTLGDGPVDAAFRAIEEVVGTHYELDEFRIRALTEGKDAMSETVVRLRTGGKVYSGRGVSTDIIGASIRAYISALNKICFEEA
ncbi:MAG: hypothetical protein IJV96_06170 [Clostridia bacterium]|nr:hypothetical protein [Clostridia bacterium]